MNTELAPACLRWARERAGLTASDLAAKMRTSEGRIAAWETTGRLTLAQAEKWAHVTHTPFGYLFLKEPPTETLPVSDFRTVETSGIVRPSPNLLDTLYDAQRRQDWYREYAAENAAPLPFVGSVRVSDSVDGAAEQIRRFVSWNSAARAEAQTADKALSAQVDALEDAGVLVMRNGVVGNNTSRPLDVGEFRGFALSDAYAPLIFLNGKDAKAAQMFTLAHEFVHLCLGVSGVSNLSFTYAADNQTERFCNAVAAELLVPLADLRPQWEEVKARPDAVTRLGRSFKVSSLVILRRLRDAGILTKEQFQTRYADELAQIHGRSSSAGGGDFYRTLRTRLGKRLPTAVVESTLEGRTLYRDAFRLLGVSNAEHLRRLGIEIGAIA